MKLINLTSLAEKICEHLGASPENVGEDFARELAENIERMIFEHLRETQRSNESDSEKGESNE